MGTCLKFKAPNAKRHRADIWLKNNEHTPEPQFYASYPALGELLIELIEAQKRKIESKKS